MDISQAPKKNENLISIILLTVMFYPNIMVQILKLDVLKRYNTCTTQKNLHGAANSSPPINFSQIMDSWGLKCVL